MRHRLQGGRAIAEVDLADQLTDEQLKIVKAQLMELSDEGFSVHWTNLRHEDGRIAGHVNVHWEYSVKHLGRIVLLDFDQDFSTDDSVDLPAGHKRLDYGPFHFEAWIAIALSGTIVNGHGKVCATGHFKGTGPLGYKDDHDTKDLCVTF